MLVVGGGKKKCSQSVEEEKEGGTSALHPRPVGNKQAWPPSTARRRLLPFNLEGGGERKRRNHMTGGGGGEHSALSENSPQQTGEKICGPPVYENKGWRYRLLCHRMLVIAPPLCGQTQHAALFKGSFGSPGSTTINTLSSKTYLWSTSRIDLMSPSAKWECLPPFCFLWQHWRQTCWFQMRELRMKWSSVNSKFTSDPVQMEGVKILVLAKQRNQGGIPPLVSCKVSTNK